MVVEPKLSGNRFTFTIQLSPKDPINVDLKVQGDRLEGRFNGDSAPRAAERIVGIPVHCFFRSLDSPPNAELEEAVAGCASTEDLNVL